MDVVSRVSRGVGGGVWLDGELSLAPRTSVWLGETKLVSASSFLPLPHPLFLILAFAPISRGQNTVPVPQVN